MAKERLSKLQKWILKAIAQSESGFIYRKDIYLGYYKLKESGWSPSEHSHSWRVAPERWKRAYPAVGVSIKNLVKKGLVKRYSQCRYGNPDNSMIKIDEYLSLRESEYWGDCLMLTDEGKKKVESLNINLYPNQMKLNNKDSGNEKS